MSNLRIVLWTKAVITFGLWSFPLLFFPAELLKSLGLPISEPIIFLRLLGMAYTALVVCYVFGALKEENEYPSEAVWVGIVSNGGASLLLFIGALLGAWSQWSAFAKTYMWVSLICVTLLTLGLIITGPLGRDSA